MKIIKLEQIGSTQDYLKKLLPSQRNNQDILVITKHQQQGIGRHGNYWDFIPGSIACSFTLKPHPVMTLTSLEIAVLVKNFFQTKHHLNLELKWPNDLFFKNKKCGGIIIHNDQQQLIVGLGINNHTPLLESEDWRIGLPLKESMTENLVHYIHQNRITKSQKIIKQWEDSCLHQGKIVTIDKTQGIFVGVGEYGEALIQTEQKQLKKFYSGSLRF